MFYVAVDVGCIECGEDTHVLGIFSDHDAAIKVCDDHEARQSENWHGQHRFEVHEVPALNEAVVVAYV